MTLDDVACKTNEFQQRRKLRLQQVREQSKDIAKKIRHRAKVEKLRHASNADNRKEKEYFECQEKFVKRLQQIYSENLMNIGKAHNEIQESKEAEAGKQDLSKLRGKEAAAELKRKKQEKLDEQKKILDRKVKAREVANELSREKSLTVIQKLSKDSNKVSEEESKKDNQVVTEQSPDNDKDDCELVTNDIGVQWESPKPTTSQPEESTQRNNTDKNKKINLFALSDEMTLNMNEELAKSSDRPSVRPSLSMVSEYLQNRNLRLRETEPIKRKPTEDLQSIRQTILQTRAPKADGNKQKSFRSTISHDSPSKRSLVTVYDHTKKDSRCLPCGDGGFVQRDEHTDNDAYANAYKETTAAQDVQQDMLNKQQNDMRGKIAIHRQNVDKEYRETLSFLNSLQKDVTAPSMSNAYYATEEQRKRQRDLHQKKLEEEFKKVQRENCKHSCKHSRKKVVTSDRNCSRSPNNLENKKIQYSWMPVPESDGSLAIHTLPVKDKPGKDNTVKFSHVNSYHEYRSRHKHTPPTKDVSDKPKRVVVVEENESSECNSSSASETGSVQDLNLDKNEPDDTRLSDADRIIIYKILNSKKDKSLKERKKKDKTSEETNKQTSLNNASTQNKESLDVLENFHQNASHHEGLYKAVKSNRLCYKVTRVGSGVQISGTSVKWNSWWDNIEASCIADRHQKDKENDNASRFCKCSNDFSKEKSDADNGRVSKSNSKKCDQCNSVLEQSSSSSFKTAKNDKKSSSDDGYIRLTDGISQENSKFYIGASGFLKDSDYEVIIQLRKKEGENTEKKIVTEVQSVDSANVEVLENNTTRTPSLLPDKDVATSNDSGICQEQAEVADKETQNIESNKNIASTNIDNNKDGINAAESETTKKPTTCEKAVHTSFHNSFAIRENVEAAAKATSTCTQTNFSSPTPRPAFMHMSTSTSTAYMSPPDVILPRLLRQKYDATTDPYDSSNSVSNGRKSNTHRNIFKCKKNKQKYCNCAKCELKVRCPSKKSDSRKTTSATPPNTCRTIYRCDLQSHKNRLSKPHCQKHKNRADVKSNRCHRRPTSSTADSLKTSNAVNMFNSRYLTKLTQSQIDPILKKYINKLLSLNQEGLKAIDIINQDCSDVPTPSNSVINVPSNVNKLNCLVENKISLEQIKNILKNEIINQNIESAQIKNDDKRETAKQAAKKIGHPAGRKRFHKVKSLNISKKVLKNSSKKTNSQCEINSARSRTSSAVHSKRTDGDDTVDDSQVLKARKHNTSSPVSKNTVKSSDNNLNRSQNSIRKVYAQIANVNEVINNALHKHSYPNNAKAQFVSSDSDTYDRITSYVNSTKQPNNMSSKANDGIGSDIDCMKIAEDKIQNIEKLADLTEKCTKRISNLAKVLEEVRRNKSLVYSQISSTDVSSGSDNRSDTSVHKDRILKSNSKDNKIGDNVVKNSTQPSGNVANKNGMFGFTQLLKDIPKPDVFKSHQASELTNTDTKDYSSSNSDSANVKYKSKPPPALSRHLKHVQDVFVAPHELSTVVEVDSPMSVQMKSHSKPNINSHNTHQNTAVQESDSYSELKVDKNQNTLHKSQFNRSRTEVADDSKLEMMNMKQFNNIMLKPFVSLQEYAKQCNIENIEDGSVTEDVSKDRLVSDAASNSENSLPDVMTELLKRNVISEPFKFDTSSNNNSTSLSSESATSLLALSKAQKTKKLNDAKLKLQKCLMDTSETSNTSSNPDLENAFQKLGIGWASSTLKKTKERLALLTSSSSTSSTSLRKFNMKSFNLEVPTLGTDSISSLMSIKDEDKKSSFTKIEENIKNNIQHTSPNGSMNVKEFLNNELAKKITFDNSKSKAPEEFVSLYETKMPEEIKNPRGNYEEHSVSTSSPNNRARTSTPVRNVFKSSTYHTSSSSSTSNGLFSNADDLSSVKGTSNSIRNHSTSDKEDLTIPNYSLKLKKGCNLSKSD